MCLLKDCQRRVWLKLFRNDLFHFCYHRLCVHLFDFFDHFPVNQVDRHLIRDDDLGRCRLHGQNLLIKKILANLVNFHNLYNLTILDPLQCKDRLMILPLDPSR